MKLRYAKHKYFSLKHLKQKCDTHPKVRSSNLQKTYSKKLARIQTRDLTERSLFPYQRIKRAKQSLGDNAQRTPAITSRAAEALRSLQCKPPLREKAVFPGPAITNT